MKILLINYEYPPIGGGAGNATMFIARALVQLGHDVVVLTAGFQELSGESMEDGVQICRIHTGRTAPDRSNLLEKAGFLWAALRSARTIAREREIEGVIVFFTLPCGPIAWMLKVSLGIPYIVSLRGGDVPGLVPELHILHRILTPIRRLVLRSADGIVANSDSLARLAKDKDPFDVRVVPNGVDPSYFAPGGRCRGDPLAPFVMLFVGRIHTQKNLALVLRSLRKIASEGNVNVRLHVVGDGPLRPQMEALAQREALAQSQGSGVEIVWHGWLAKSELANMYKVADVFVNPSLYEGMPNTVLEAMSSGLPVVASDVGGNNSLVQNGVTGFLFDLKSEGEFVDAVIALVRDPDLARRMGAAGRKRITSEFSWREVARAYIDIFPAVAVPAR